MGNLEGCLKFCILMFSTRKMYYKNNFTFKIQRELFFQDERGNCFIFSLNNGKDKINMVQKPLTL